MFKFFLYQFSQIFLNNPNNLFEWLSLLLISLSFTLFFLKHKKTFAYDIGKRWKLFCLLVVITPIAVVFFGVQLSDTLVFPLPGTPLEINSTKIMFLSNIPWVIAAGIFGPAPALIIGGLTGFTRSLWETHNLFSVFEAIIIVYVFIILTIKSSRAKAFSFFKYPFATLLLIVLLYTPLYFIMNVIFATGNMAIRLDYAILKTGLFMISRGGELLVAGLVAEVGYRIKRRKRGFQDSAIDSSRDLSLREGLFYRVIPTFTVLFVFLSLVNWVIASEISREIFKNRLETPSSLVAEGIPNFIETGHKLLFHFATSELIDQSPYLSSLGLESRIRELPYFSQLIVFNDKGEYYSGFPNGDALLTPEELSGLQLALKGVTGQVYMISPESSGFGGQLSFLTPLSDRFGNSIGVLLGRTDVVSNPMFSPNLLVLMDVLRDLNGEGYIIDQSGHVLYQTTGNLIDAQYLKDTGQILNVYKGISANGARQFILTTRITSPAWLIFVAVPMEKIFFQSVKIALPFFVSSILLFCVIILIWFGLYKKIMRSVTTINNEAILITQGQLDPQLSRSGDDEIGQINRAFDKTRKYLKKNIDELNQRLLVIKGVASSLQLTNSLETLLKISMMGGATSARVVISTNSTGYYESTINSVGHGQDTNTFAYLDNQIFDIMMHQDVLNVPNTVRMRRLIFNSETEKPGALVAFALRDGRGYYGAFWIAFRTSQTFDDPEINRLTDLAEYAALAVVQARQYNLSENERQRLEIVFNSISEPVIVVDMSMRLLFINGAGKNLRGLIVSSEVGRPINEVISHPTLLEFIALPIENKVSSKEVGLSNNHFYSASLSLMVFDKDTIGKICILQDITHYKHLDTLKSEFVSTVSHDLRSPLTLMNGYATMLQMVGELNAQQKGYIAKITSGVESMTRLVNNLLDLGRIEKGVGLRTEKVIGIRIIEAVISSLQPQATQKKIQLNYEAPVLQPVIIEADPALLQQALYNLVDNAIKFTQLGGQVVVRLQTQPSSAIFEIHDTGIGIAPLDLPHTFEKFYRSAGKESSQYRGTGLGLTIVRSIAEYHHGNVWVESQLGKGSTFFLEIPFKH